MILALFLSQANAADASLGASVASLLSSLSAAAAAVVVTSYFLGFLKTHGEDQQHIIDEFRGYHAESQRKFQDQIDRLADRQSESLKTFRAQVGRVSETQNAMLKDAIVTMRSIEKSLEGSISTIHGIESTIDSLKQAIGAIDGVIATANEERSGTAGARAAGDPSAQAASPAPV